MNERKIIIFERHAHIKKHKRDELFCTITLSPAALDGISLVREDGTNGNFRLSTLTPFPYSTSRAMSLPRENEIPPPKRKSPGTLPPT